MGVWGGYCYRDWYVDENDTDCFATIDDFDWGICGMSRVEYELDSDAIADLFGIT